MTARRPAPWRAPLLAVLVVGVAAAPACSDDDDPRAAPSPTTTTTTEPAPPDPAGPAPQALLDQCVAVNEVNEQLHGGAVVDAAAISPVVTSFSQSLRAAGYEGTARSIDDALAGEMAAEYNALQLAASWCASPPTA